MPRVPVRVRQAADGSQWITSRELSENIFGSQRRTHADECRRYFGSGITPETIESVLRRADNGFMRDLADLAKESLFFDPHLMSVTSKRFRALASVVPKVVQAEGPGVDEKKAKQYAEELRVQLSRLPNFRQQVTRLNWGHFNGRAALEKVWRETRGGANKYDLVELNWLHARRLAFGPERDLRVRDDAWGGAAFEDRGLAIERIPHKFLTYKPQLFDEVAEREGFGARALYWSFFKRFSWRERMILVEVFGKPWRILKMAPGSPYTDEGTLDDLQERADEMGANASAAFPPGVELGLENPDPKSTDPHDKTSDKCDDQVSKLVLGVTMTTDAKATGLGSQLGLVHQDGETLVIAADGWGIGDCLSWGIARDYVALNYGESEAVNAPAIEMVYEAAPDQTTEIDRTGKVLGFGIPLKTDEVYRRCGYEKPEEGDEVVSQESVTDPLGGLPSKSVSTGVLGGTGEGEGNGTADDPLAQVAASTRRSLRLSRLSKGYFSGR